MSPENRDFSTWEYTGHLLTPRQAEIFDRTLLGRSIPETARDLNLSLASVKHARRRIRDKIEMETGFRPKDALEMLTAMIQIGEVSYNPKRP